MQERARHDVSTRAALSGATRLHARELDAVVRTQVILVHCFEPVWRGANQRARTCQPCSCHCAAQSRGRQRASRRRRACGALCARSAVCHCAAARRVAEQPVARRMSHLAARCAAAPADSGPATPRIAAAPPRRRRALLQARAAWRAKAGPGGQVGGASARRLFGRNFGMSYDKARRPVPRVTTRVVVCVRTQPWACQTVSAQT